MDLKISSTVGFERAHNPTLSINDEDEFVKEALAKLGPQPPNLEAIVALNKGPLRTDGTEIRPLAPKQVEERRAAGALLVDARTDQQFDDAHIAGAVCIPMLSAGFGSRLAWLADHDQEIVLIGRDDEDGRRAARLAIAVGISNFAGFLGGGMTSWRQENRAVEQIERLPLEELKDRLTDDDRTSGSRCARTRRVGEGSHPWIDFRAVARHRRIPEGLDPSRPVAVVCGSGERAAVGASLLKRYGGEKVIHVVDGGVPKWKRLGLPIEDGES